MWTRLGFLFHLKIGELARRTVRYIEDICSVFVCILCMTCLFVCAIKCEELCACCLGGLLCCLFVVRSKTTSLLTGTGTLVP